MDINWGAIVLVFVIGLAATVVVVGAYSFGIRLLATGSPDEGAERQLESGPHLQPSARPGGATAVGYLCFALAGAAVLYGLYLIVPQFH
jgi:hypothetical protein